MAIEIACTSSRSACLAVKCIIVFIYKNFKNNNL